MQVEKVTDFLLCEHPTDVEISGSEWEKKYDLISKASNIVVLSKSIVLQSFSQWNSSGSCKGCRIFNSRSKHCLMKVQQPVLEVKLGGAGVRQTVLQGFLHDLRFYDFKNIFHERCEKTIA